MKNGQPCQSTKQNKINRFHVGAEAHTKYYIVLASVNQIFEIETEKNMNNNLKLLEEIRKISREYHKADVTLADIAEDYFSTDFSQQSDLERIRLESDAIGWKLAIVMDSLNEIHRLVESIERDLVKA